MNKKRASVAQAVRAGRTAARPVTDTKRTAKNAEHAPAAIAAGPRYGDIVRAQQREAGRKRKGERTRDSLKLAAIEVLGEVGFRSMRVADICERAQISSAAFYLYFKNKEQITVEVLKEFLDALFSAARTPEGHTPTLYGALYQTNLTWISAVRANAGLMRCLLQLSDEIPEFKQISERWGYEWFAHVTHGLLRRFPQAGVDERTVLLAVYALGGMMDEISRRLLVTRDPQLTSLVAEVAPTDAAFAELLSILWYRALFRSEPPGANFPASQELLRMATLLDADEASAKPARGK